MCSRKPRTALLTNFGRGRLRPSAPVVRLVGCNRRVSSCYTVKPPAYSGNWLLLCRFGAGRVARTSRSTLAPTAGGLSTITLSTHFVWPTYTALAKRIGLLGSTTFLRRTDGFGPRGRPGGKIAAGRLRIRLFPHCTAGLAKGHAPRRPPSPRQCETAFCRTCPSPDTKTAITIKGSGLRRLRRGHRCRAEVHLAGSMVSMLAYASRCLIPTF